MWHGEMARTARLCQEGPGTQDSGKVGCLLFWEIKEETLGGERQSCPHWSWAAVGWEAGIKDLSSLRLAGMERRQGSRQTLPSRALRPCTVLSSGRAMGAGQEKSW